MDINLNMQGTNQTDIYAIGRFCNEKGYNEAYKIYDRKTKKTRVVGKHELKKIMVDQNLDIGGLQVITRTYDTDKGFITLGLKVQRKKGMHNIYKLEEIDGKGNVKTKPTVYVLMGFYRFGVDRLYVCVDAEGKEHILDHEVFMEKVSNNEIIGATIRNNKLSIYKDSKNQFYT